MLSIASIELHAFSLLLLLHHSHALIFFIIVLLLYRLLAGIPFGLILSDDIRLFLLLLFLILIFGFSLLSLSLFSGLSLLPLPVLLFFLLLAHDLILLLLVFGLLLLVLSLLPLHLLLLFGLLPHHLLLHAGLLLGSSVVLLVLAPAKDLAHVGSRVEAASRRTEQLLQEVVGVVGLQTCHDLRRFNVDFLTDHHFRQSDHL